MHELLFWICSALAVSGGLAVVCLKNPLYCALSLVGAFVALAGLYLELKASFPAVLQVMVYAGAVMVLVVFVIMFLNVPEDSQPENEFARSGVVLAVFLLVPLAALLIGVVWSAGLQPFQPAQDSFGGIRATGRELFGTWLYPFEALSLLIVAAMVGAVLVAKKRLAEHE